MSLAMITFEQTLILTLFVLMGAGLFKFRLITQEGLPSLTNLLLFLVNPLLILDSFSNTAYDPRLSRGMLSVALFAVLVHVLSIVLANLAFKQEDQARRKVMAFSMVFTNCGFFGLPLLKAIAGNEGVFYGAIYIAVFKLFCWTYGVALMDGTGKKTGGLIKAVINPNTLAIAVGLLFYFTQWQLPGILKTSFHSIGLLNSPLAMILVGVQMAALGVGGFLKDRLVWKTSLLRMLALPLLALGMALLLLPNQTMAVCCLALASTPTAVIAVMFAGKYKQDVRLSAQILTLTTLLSILVIPGMVSLYEVLRQI